MITSSLGGHSKLVGQVPSRQAENEAFERTERRKRILIGVAVALGIGVLVWVGLRSSAGPLNNPYAVRCIDAESGSCTLTNR